MIPSASIHHNWPSSSHVTSGCRSAMVIVHAAGSLQTTRVLSIGGSAARIRASISAERAHRMWSPGSPLA